ncbi:MAG: Integrase core domain protein [Chlorobi bacterium OLB7]|nr:MAG: Integrase core domain protein [Chlorobi bacterium OLB7]
MIELTEELRTQLRKLQRMEKEKRRYVKITTLLMLDGGFSVGETAFALGVDNSTIYRYAEGYRASKSFEDYIEDKYVCYGGKLSGEQASAVSKELEGHLHHTSKEVVELVCERYGVRYTESGMVALLKRLGFVYKKTSLVPSKGNRAEQEEFLERLAGLLADRGEGEEGGVVYFSDAVHPQHNTRSSYGWIKSGSRYEVRSNTGRERVNINAALNAHDVGDVEVVESERVDSESTIELYAALERKHPSGRIRVICDNARYYRSRRLREWLSSSRIEQVFLPSYSPNLNLIERLWKYMRKKVIDRRYYETKDEFRGAIRRFFNDIEEYRPELERLLTLNFHVL